MEADVWSGFRYINRNKQPHSHTHFNRYKHLQTPAHTYLNTQIKLAALTHPASQHIHTHIILLAKLQAVQYKRLENAAKRLSIHQDKIGGVSWSA